MCRLYLTPSVTLSPGGEGDDWLADVPFSSSIGRTDRRKGVRRCLSCTYQSPQVLFLSDRQEKETGSRAVAQDRVR